MGFVIGFSPWIVYWILVGNTSFRAAVLIALALSVLAVVVQRVRRQPWHSLEVGAVVVFVVLTVLAFTVSDVFLQRWLQPLGNAGIFLISLVGILIGRPFVREYATASVDATTAHTDGFRVITTAMTWMWTAVFGLMTIISAIPPIVQGQATIHDGASTLSIVCYWVVPFTLMGLAGTASGLFPPWFDRQTKRIDQRESAGTPARPVAQPAALPDEIDPQIVVTAPVESRHDEPFSVGADAAGLANVSIVMSGQDLFGRLWQWQGVLAGTGQTADDMIYAMEFVGPDDRADLFIPPAEPWQLRVEATSADHRTAVTVLREPTAPGVTLDRVDVDGRPGLLARPGSAGPHPSVVCFGGSEGGLDSQIAVVNALASRGIMALAYSWLDDVPEAAPIADIPLERFAGAIGWLAAHRAASGDGVAAVAISRGAEGLAATLARATDLPVSAAVLLSPSNVTWQAIGPDGEMPDTSSWTYRGRPCEYAALPSGVLMPQLVGNAWRLSRDVAAHRPTLLRLRPAYESGLSALRSDSAARIESERITCPLLCVSGSDDRLWPSEPMSDALIGRRTGRPDKHIRYEGAGHFLRPGLYPATVQVTGGIDMGGRPREHGLACLALTGEIADFISPK